HKSLFENKCRKLEKKTFEHATNIVVYSQPMIDYCVKNICSDTTKYKIHQNIDFSRFQFFEGEKDYSNGINICFVGSFLKWHRVDLLLQAYKKILAEFPDKKLHLYLIGDGMEKERMESLAKQLDLTNYTFTGYKDGQELIELQMKMHIGVMPGSNWYGAPNKLFEYGAMKMAVIAPDTPTINYNFSENQILLFKIEDISGIQVLLQQLIENEKLLLTCSELNFEFITKHYSANKTYRFYKLILLNNQQLP
ncbi:MAG: glycosyltransferase, partial [Crocinitomicaceae bacterium]|nr:glycosyltransferase [Crocinitomicaceae bacterium]